MENAYYIIRITFYLLPMLAECGRGSISLQSPVTYQVETDQCKRSFESVMPDCVTTIPFDILVTAIQTSSQAFFPSSATILLVVWSANSDVMVVLFTSNASSNSLNNGDAPFQVNLLIDDTYRWNCKVRI